jgi:hypothetical protein
LRALLLTVALTESSDLRGEESLPERPTKTNLFAFLDVAKRALPRVGTTLELKPHWVGTVKRVYLRDQKGVYRADTPEDIRFTHLVVQQDEQGDKRLVIARLRWDPDTLLTSAGRYAAALRENLPSVDDLAKVARLGDLFGLCGPQHGGTDGWGDLSGTIYWTEEWTSISPVGDDRLRYLNVLAHVSGPVTKGGKLPRLDRTNAAVDILVVREGVFRCADPNSAEERKRFLTAEEIFACNQAERDRERAKYPKPLRGLIEASEKPDDWEMAAYIDTINHIRTNPDPLLFQQLVSWMNEKEVEMSGHLEDILFFDDPPPELQPWKKGPRQAALRALIEAISAARNPDCLEEALLAVLMADGGGKLKFQVPGTDVTIDLAAKKRSDGFEKTYACAGLSETNIVQVVGHCQAVLKKKHAEIWPKPTPSQSSNGTQR